MDDSLLPPQSRDDLELWIKNRIKDDDGRYSINDWLFWIEHVRSYSRQYDDKERACAYVRLITMMYDHLHGRGVDTSRRCMLLYSEAIRTYGHFEGHDILDVHHIYQWFLKTLPMSYSQTVQSIPQTLDMVQTLRNIKNNINVLRGIPDELQEKTDDIVRWMNLWKDLP